MKTTDGEYILEKSNRGKLKGGEVTNWVAKPEDYIMEMKILLFKL